MFVFVCLYVGSRLTNCNSRQFAQSNQRISIIVARRDVFHFINCQRSFQDASLLSFLSFSTIFSTVMYFNFYIWHAANWSTDENTRVRIKHNGVCHISPKTLFSLNDMQFSTQKKWPTEIFLCDKIFWWISINHIYWYWKLSLLKINQKKIFESN